MSKQRLMADLCKVKVTPGMFIIGHPEEQNPDNPFEWEMTVGVQFRDNEPLLRVWAIHGRTYDEAVLNLRRRAYEMGYQAVGVLSSRAPIGQGELVCQN